MSKFKHDVVLNWVLAQWLLSIWNPGLVPFSKRQALAYRCRGIVLHDRALNGEDM